MTSLSSSSSVKQPAQPLTPLKSALKSSVSKSSLVTSIASAALESEDRETSSPALKVSFGEISVMQLEVESDPELKFEKEKPDNSCDSDQDQPSSFLSLALQGISLSDTGSSEGHSPSPSPLIENLSSLALCSEAMGGVSEESEKKADFEEVLAREQDALESTDLTESRGAKKKILWEAIQMKYAPGVQQMLQGLTISQSERESYITAAILKDDLETVKVLINYRELTPEKKDEYYQLATSRRCSQGLVFFFSSLL